MNLTIGVVTRGRPELIEWTVRETVKNIELPGTRLIVLGDHDDEKLFSVRFPEKVIVDIDEREDSVGAKWNRMTRIAPADGYLTMVDYAPNLTPGFDRKIVQALGRFPDGVGVLCNHLANLSFPIAQVVTSKFVEIAGGVYTEHFPYWFVDHWLDDVAKMIGRLSFVDFKVDVSKRPGTQDMREPCLWAALYDGLQDEREALAERLLAQMDEPEWRKEILRSYWPLIHQRSRMINGMVRGLPNKADWDERYKRIRAVGLGKLQSLYEHMERKAA